MRAICAVRLRTVLSPGDDPAHDVLVPGAVPASGDVIVALAWYFLAKVLEAGPVDHGVYGMGHVVSGHTLKHLATALGAYWLYRMIRFRRPLPTATRP